MSGVLGDMVRDFDALAIRLLSLDKKVDIIFSDLNEWKGRVHDSLVDKELIFNHEISKNVKKIDDRLHGFDIRIEDIASKIKTCVSFDIIHNEIQMRETWQNGFAIRINDLNERLLNIEKQLKELLSPTIRFTHDYINKTLKDEQIEKQKESITQMLDKIKSYENRIEVLNDCLDRKSRRCDNLNEQYDKLQKEYERDCDSYIARIKEMQQVIADRNKEIFDLRNPQIQPGNCT